MRTICVYAASTDRLHPEYFQAARSLGETIALRGFTLVYGAGKTGLMGAVADGALSAKGQVIGVMPAMFDTPQLAHQGLTRYEVVETIQQRKARLAEMADTFIALPGGYGTFEELFEMLTWAQIGLHNHPIGLLNTRGYFDPLLAMIAHAQSEGFIYNEDKVVFTYHEDPSKLLDKLADFQTPEGLDRWLNRPNSNHMSLHK